MSAGATLIGGAWRLACGMSAAWVLAAALAAPAARAQTAADHQAIVSDALREQRSAEALSALDAWQRSETAGGATVNPARLFLRGAALQQQAAAASGAERDTALAGARQAYQESLALKPGNPRAFHNLALLESSAGNAAEALAWARRAATAAPGDGAAWELVVSLHRAQQGSTGLARQLDAALQAGQTILVARSALTTLREDRSAGERWPLLLVATRAMARDPLLVRDQKDAPEGLRPALQALTDDPALATAARQLLVQLTDPRPQRDQASAWWPNMPDASGHSPRSVLRGLALAKAAAATDAQRAERWWTLAIELGEHGPDPEAFVGLVAHLAARERTDQLAPLMRRYEGELFSEKSAAYHTGDWTQIYRMHLALGMAYGHLKVWRSSGSPYQNAVFQLEAAMRAAERANREGNPARRPREPLALSAQGLTLLAEGHAALGAPQRGTQLQLQGAEQLVKLQRTSDAALVVDGISAEKVRAAGSALETRYDSLRAATRGVPR